MSHNDVTRGLMRSDGGRGSRSSGWDVPALCWCEICAREESAVGGARQRRGAPPGSGSDSPLGGRAVRNFRLAGGHEPRLAPRRRPVNVCLRILPQGPRCMCGWSADRPSALALGAVCRECPLSSRAHSVNVCRRRHRLSAHSRATADLARAFAAPFGAGGLAAALGLLHDAGKASTAWQRRLLMVEAAPGKGGCAAQGTRRAIGLRRGRHRIDLDGRVAVVVDDGVATGSTARAACAVARELGAAAGPVVSLPVTVPLRPAASRSAWCSTGAGLRSAAPHRCGTASPGTG